MSKVGLLAGKFAISGIAGATLGQFIVIASGAISGIALARTLGPGARGELALVLLWSGILTLFGDLGLGFSFSYYAAKLPDRLSDLWSMSIVIGGAWGAAVALGGWIILPKFVPILGQSLQREFDLSLLSVPIILTSGYQAYILLGLGQVGDYVSIRLFSALFYLVLVMCCALSGYGRVIAFVGAYDISQLAALLFSLWSVRSRFHPVIKVPRDLWRDLLTFGFKTQLATIAAQANLRADQTVMSVFLVAQQLGQYVVAVSISSILNPFLGAIALVLVPQAAGMECGGKAALLIARKFKIALVGCIPIMIAAIAAMPLALPLLFGKEYRPAVLSAQILTFAGLFQGLNSILGNGLRGLGHPGLPAVAEAVGLLSTAVFLFFLLPSYGIAGAALASLFAYFTVTVVEFLFVARQGEVSASALLLVPLDYDVKGRLNRFRRVIAAGISRSVGF